MANELLRKLMEVIGIATPAQLVVVLLLVFWLIGAPALVILRTYIRKRSLDGSFGTNGSSEEQIREA